MAHRTGVEAEMIVDYLITLPIIKLPLRSNNIYTLIHMNYSSSLIVSNLMILEKDAAYFCLHFITQNLSFR